MAYRTGYQAINSAVEKAKSNNGSGGGRTQLFGWNGKKEGGDKKFIRLLDDEPIVIGFHQWVPCVDGKKRDFVCSAQLAEPRECIICKMTRTLKNGNTVNLRPSDVGLGLAALRIEEREGRQLIYKDYVHNKPPVSDEQKEQLKEAGIAFDDEGNVKDVPWIGVVRQSVGNFWSNFDAYYARYGTTTDRDYEVTRQGADLNTKYIVIPCDKDENLVEPEQLEERYMLAKLLHPTLIEYIERLGAESYYDKHLLGKSTGGSNDSADEDQPQDEPAGEESAPTENKTEFSSLKAKLQGYTKK